MALSTPANIGRRSSAAGVGSSGDEPELWRNLQALYSDYGAGASGRLSPEQLSAAASRYGIDGLTPDIIRQRVRQVRSGAASGDAAAAMGDSITLSDFAAVVQASGLDPNGLDVESVLKMWTMDPNYQSAAAAFTYRSFRVEELAHWSHLTSTNSHAVNLGLSFLCGGAAGSLSKSMIAPLDRIKIMFQISNMPFSFRAVLKELRRTYAEEGFRALFRGNAAQILRVYPYSGIQLMSFDGYSRLMRKFKRQKADEEAAASNSPLPAAATRVRLGSGEKMAAGALAGATSVAITYPLDLMRARLAVQRSIKSSMGVPEREQYHGLWAAFKSMYTEHGIRGYYHGIRPTLLGVLPYAGISFATFGTLKQAWRDAHNDEEPAPYLKLIFGGIGGLAGQVTTYPLDIARRRLQTLGFTSLNAVAAHPSMGLSVLRSRSATVAAARTDHDRTPAMAGQRQRIPGIIEVQTEGIRGLWKGVSMNFIKGPVGVGVSFTTYDLLKRAFHLDEIEHARDG